MSLVKKHSTRKSSMPKKSRSKSQDVEYTIHDISSLRRQRSIAYKRMCKALEIGVSAISDYSQRDMFFSYHQDLKKISSNFEDAHFTILEILDDSENDDSGMQERFDEMYYKVISIYLSLTKNESCKSQPQRSSLSNVRLPKIQLPTFSGDIKHFPEYFDTFNALIHSSTSLSDTEKFHYLISSLSGDALTVVKTFPLSSEYYCDAYAALIARYKCKRELAFTCWREILTMNFNFKDAHEFRKSLDLFEENLCILKSVNLPVNHWDFVLVYNILSKLDTNIRRDFEEKHSDTELPSYLQLKGFLHSKCEALLRDTHFTEHTHPNKSTQKAASPSAQPKRVPVSHALIAANQAQSELGKSGTDTRSITCSYCNESHSISSCPEFLEKSIDDRMQIATDRSWCFNCLKSSHQLSNCNSVFSCRICKRKHHSLLHRHKPIEPNEAVTTLLSRSSLNSTVLLATAVVQVKDASGVMQSFRALFDTGSQSSLITESAVKRLRLNPSQSVTQVNGLGKAAASILGDVTCCISTNNQTFFTLDLHVMGQICSDQPIAKLNTTGWSHIEMLPLADPNFDTPGPIDILFAADIFAESLLNQRIKGSSNQPTAFNSVFGWLLLGKTDLAPNGLLQNSDIIKSNLLVQHSLECSLPTPNHNRDITVHNKSVNNPQLIGPRLQPKVIVHARKIHYRFQKTDIVVSAGVQQPTEQVAIPASLASPLGGMQIDKGSRTRTTKTTIYVHSNSLTTKRDTPENGQDSVIFGFESTDNLSWSDCQLLFLPFDCPSIRPKKRVSNRVSSQYINPSEFGYHISFRDNSVDIHSQRKLASEILHNSLRWAEPPWLLRHHKYGLSVAVQLLSMGSLIKTTERHLVMLHIIVNTIDLLVNSNLCLPYFSFTRWITFTAPRGINLRITEWQKMLTRIVKREQNQALSEDVGSMKSIENPLTRLPKLKSNISHQGMLRVSAKIPRSGFNSDHKHHVHQMSDHSIPVLIIITTCWTIFCQFLGSLSKRVHCYPAHLSTSQPIVSDLPCYLQYLYLRKGTQDNEKCEPNMFHISPNCHCATNNHTNENNFIDSIERLKRILTYRIQKACRVGGRPYRPHLCCRSQPSQSFMSDRSSYHEDLAKAFSFKGIVCSGPSYMKELFIKTLKSIPDEELTRVYRHRLHRWQLLQAFNSILRFKLNIEHAQLLIHQSKRFYRHPIHWSLYRVMNLFLRDSGATQIAVLEKRFLTYFNTYPKLGLRLLLLPED